METSRSKISKNIEHLQEEHLVISSYAREKIGAYTKIAGSWEFMFLLMGLHRLKDVVMDVFLLSGQKIGLSTVSVDGRAINESMWQLQDRYSPENWEILGWGHSHGFSPVFHSGTDDDYTESVFLEQLAPGRLNESEEVIQRSISGTKKGEFLIAGENGENTKIVLPEGGDVPEKITVETRSKKYSGSIFSLVTNQHNDFYAERFTRLWCPGCQQASMKRIQLNVVVMPVKNQFKTSESRLAEEFESKTSKENYYWKTGSMIYSSDDRMNGLIHSGVLECPNCSTSLILIKE